MEFLGPENRSNFLCFLYIEILFNKYASIDVHTTVADIMQFSIM